MKINFVSFLIGIMLLTVHWPLPSFAQTGDRKDFDESDVVEVGIDFLLAPPVGFDDNDNIQVVIHGHLPNMCYSLNDYKIERTDSRGPIRVRQFAFKETEGACKDQSTLPDYMKIPVPFTTEISVGVLRQGDYAFQYETCDHRVETYKINVARAAAPTVDSLPYAAVTNAIVPDVVNGAESVKLTLTGILTSGCTELDSAVSVSMQGNVYVVLPTLKVKPGVQCTEAVRPFRREVSLGKAAPGHYLVHVRSMSGKSVNRLVDVTR